jgi:hypothetical protein
MGGVMQKMTDISMSIGLLGQGVQLLGQNAEMIQNAVVGLLQLLAQSTHSLNELMGCESDQTSNPLRLLKVDQSTGQLVPKTLEELSSESKTAAQRRRNSRWALGLVFMCLCWWRLRHRSERSQRRKLSPKEFGALVAHSGALPIATSHDRQRLSLPAPHVEKQMPE